MEPVFAKKSTITEDFADLSNISEQFLANHATSTTNLHVAVNTTTNHVITPESFTTNHATSTTTNLTNISEQFLTNPAPSTTDLLATAEAIISEKNPKNQKKSQKSTKRKRVTKKPKKNLATSQNHTSISLYVSATDFHEEFVESALLNPWVVENAEAFLYYCCPECDHKYQTCDDFQKHALSDHPKGMN